MAQDRTALIHRVLRNLGALPQGQSPNAEEMQSIDDLIDPTVANLINRNIMRNVDPDFLEDEFFIPLAHCVAAVAAPEFGQAQDQAIWLLKERAEADLKYMYDQLYRMDSGQPRNMRTDYYPSCPGGWTYTRWSNS
jgi:hypothetical protein